MSTQGPGSFLDISSRIDAFDANPSLGTGQPFVQAQANSPSNGAPGLGFAEGMADLGLGLSVGGVGTQAIGAYYGIKGAQHEAKSAGLNKRHEESISRINARGFEVQAAEIERAGRKQLQLAQLANQQETGALVAQQGSRGIQLDSGSALEERVSLALAQEIDELTITRNTVAAAGQARLRAVNARNKADLARVSAENFRRTAGSYSPALAATTSLLSGLGGIGQQVANDRRFR